MVSGGATGWSGGRPDRDRTHALLADGARRGVIEYLAANGSSATLPELARHLSDRLEVDAMPSEQEARLRLHHTHLPKLAEAGVVERTDDGSEVRLTATGKWLERVRRRTADLFDDAT